MHTHNLCIHEKYMKKKIYIRIYMSINTISEGNNTYTSVSPRQKLKGGGGDEPDRINYLRNMAVSAAVCLAF